jgi:ribokinase
MTRILVSGLINIETALRVDSFPIAYTPVEYRFSGVNSSVSGVGFNVAKALTALGNEVVLLSIIGHDLAGKQIRSALAEENISDEFVCEKDTDTAQSIILFDAQGKRQINVDLKDIQEQVYSEDVFERAMADCSLLVLCNINFSRPFLTKAKQAEKLIATDVHAISSMRSEYNREFMRAANILFMSDELLPIPPESWAREVQHCYAPDVLVIGLGAKGALMAVRNDPYIEHIPSIKTRPVVNTIGAGDALFSAFLHNYVQSTNPYEAIRKAMVFASYKVGAESAANGFLDHDGLERLYADTN